MKLTDREWKEFSIIDILGTSKNSKAYHTKDLIFSSNTGIPYITRTNLNNGLYGLVEFDNKYLINPANSISFGAENATYFIQPFEYITGNKMYFYNKKLSLNILKFITICLNASLKDVGFGFGMGLTGKRSDKRKFILPVTSIGIPDYDFMEEYIKEKESALKKQYKEYIENRLSNPIKLPNKPKAWKEFFIEDLAEINSGRDIYDKERIVGNTPYITSTAQNNGIGYFISNSNNTLESKCLSLNRNGSIGYCFYHPYKALYSNDCRKLRLKYNSKYVGIFISNVITAQKDKYSYGYKMGTGRIKRQKVMLPVTEAGNPDYEYMENYIKYLEQKKIKEYMDYINK